MRTWLQGRWQKWLSGHSEEGSRPPGDARPEEPDDLDDAAHTVWETDAEGRNYYQSPSWYEYVGAAPGSSYGDDWLSFYHPEDRELLVREWTKSLQTQGAYVYDIQVRIRRRDGAYRWFRVSGAPIRDSSGAVSKWIGTCIDIEAQKLRAEPQRSPGRWDAAPSRPYRILIADDNADFAESLRLLLARLGHDVQVAHDAYTALDFARKHRPDVVFLDIVLPGFDGYELAKRLRQESGAAELRIFAMSGFGQDRDAGRSVQAGIDQYFVKPIDPAFISSLLTIVRRT